MQVGSRRRTDVAAACIRVRIPVRVGSNSVAPSTLSFVCKQVRGASVATDSAAGANPPWCSLTPSPPVFLNAAKHN